MVRAGLLASIAALIVLCGCQSPRNVDMSKGASSGAVLIGVKTLPPQDQDYELVLTGFDKAQNKPLGYFSGTRTWLGKGSLHPNPICIDGICYLQSKMDPGDYIIFQLVVANSPTFFGKGGLLSGRLVTSRDMSKGTYMFHVESGKITYAGTYIIFSDMTAVDRTLNGAQTADSHPGEHGEPEPTVTYEMDVGAAQMALKSFKGANVEMVSSKPEQVTFAQ
jgi:hypothetical protein